MSKCRVPLKLIAADLDGTLLDNSYKLLPELVEAVQRAREKGVYFTLATGRLYPSARSYADELGISIPLITYNGALVRDEKQTLLHQTLSAETLLELFAAIRDEPLRKYVFINDNIITDHYDEATAHYARALGVEFLLVDDLLQEVKGTKPTMAVLRGEPEIVAKVTPYLRELFQNRLYLANSRPFFLDIAASAVSKGSGLAALARKLGFKREEIMAAGDNGNDIEMLEYAGVGVAVGNAEKMVKEHADYVSGASYSLGVVEAMEKFL